MRLTRSLILLLLLAGPAAAAPDAALWLPAGAAGAEEIILALENSPSLRLTAAFRELPPALAARALKLEAAGKLELALRTAGDPPMPLLYYPSLPEVAWQDKPSTSTLPGSDPYFTGARLALARDEAQRLLGKTPRGLALSPGGLAPDLFPLARALGAAWIASGPLASSAPAADVGGIRVIPFSSWRASSAPAGGFIVFDEASDPRPSEAREALKAALAAGALTRTVTQAAAALAAAPLSPAEAAALAAPWTGDYSSWAASPLQRGALAALARTRGDLMLHLNALGGDTRASKPAFDEYFAAEEGPKLLALAGADEEAARETEIEMRSALSNSYRLMGKTPPPWTFTSLSEAGQEEEEAETLQVSVSTAGFEVKNVSRRPELPSLPSDLPAGTDPYRLWKLDRFALELREASVVFRLYPLEAENSARNPSGFGRVAADIYIDINNRLRAGVVRPLEGRPLRLYPEDAWEYALEITPQKASLYASTPKGPAVTATARPRLENGAITVELPRSALRGNPLLWGYAALLLAPGTDKKFHIADHVAGEISNGYIRALRPGRAQR